MTSTEQIEKIQSNRPKMTGWLSFLGLGVVLNPLRILSTLVTEYSPVFSNGSFFSLYDKNPEIARILIFDLFGTFFLLVAATYLLILFVDHSKKFPPAMVLIYLLDFGFLGLEYLFTSSSPTVPSKMSEQVLVNLYVTLSFFCLWTPYLLFSKQVEEVFGMDSWWTVTWRNRSKLFFRFIIGLISVVGIILSLDQYQPNYLLALISLLIGMPIFVRVYIRFWNSFS